MVKYFFVISLKSVIMTSYVDWGVTMKYGSRQCFLYLLAVGILLSNPIVSQADFLDNWTALPQENALYGLAYGNGTFVAVGDLGTILSSSDGITWFPRSVSGTDLWLKSVAYGNGSFVAVGDFGAVLTSTDGITWITRVEPTVDPPGSSLSFVVYGNGLFVAVGWNLILTSPDGISWTDRSPGTKGWFSGVAYGNGLFVAVGGYGANLAQGLFLGTIHTSRDGVTWVLSEEEYLPVLTAATYGNGSFVAVGEYGSVLTSSDGITWGRGGTGISHYLCDVAYGNGFFVSVGEFGTAFTSRDLKTWARRNLGTTDILLGVRYGNRSFVTVGPSIRRSGLSSGLNLSPGWNFMSLPQQPVDTAVAHVLADVSSTMLIVWGYDNQNKQWKKWQPHGTTNNLLEMEAGKGYWIYMNETGTIDISGWMTPVSAIHLYKGWNLIGYTGSDNRNIQSALNAIPGSWSLVWGWENPSWQARHRFIPTLPVPTFDSFRQMKAYWIRVDGEETNWTQ
jgi:hypothetical protein